MTALLREPAGRATVAYYVAFIALGLATAALGPTLPGLGQQTGAPLRVVSVIFATQSAGYILGSLAGGQLYDRLSGHPVMFMALLGIAAMLAAVPVLTTVTGLAIVFFAIGLFQGGLDVGGNTLIGWLHGSRVGPYMNSLHFFFGVGAFAAPLVVAVTLANFQNAVAWAYWALAILVALAAVGLLGRPSPTSAYTRDRATDGPQPFLLIALIVFFYFLYVGAEHTFGGWVYSYASSQSTDQPVIRDSTQAAYLNSAFWGAFTVGRLIAIPVANWVRPRTILLTDLLLACASLGVIVLYPGSQAALWIGVIGFGMALASVFPTMLTWAGRRIRLSGSVTGLFFVGGSTGAMLFPWLTGQFFERFGAAASIWTVLGITVAVLLVFFAVMARGGPPRMGESERI